MSEPVGGVGHRKSAAVGLLAGCGWWLCSWRGVVLCRRCMLEDYPGVLARQEIMVRHMLATGGQVKAVDVIETIAAVGNDEFLLRPAAPVWMDSGLDVHVALVGLVVGVAALVGRCVRGCCSVCRARAVRVHDKQD